MAPAIKRKQPSLAATTRPITAFFERKRPAPIPSDPSLNRAQREASNAADLVEEIDPEVDENDHESGADVTVLAAPLLRQSTRPGAPQELNTAHLVRVLHRRELGSGAVMLARSVPCSSARRRKQQTEQRLARWALTRFRELPLTLALPDEAMRAVQSHRLASHCSEFYASCMAFDSHGALLVVGSSNGAVALFDCDELFHRIINVQQKSVETANKIVEQVEPSLHPLHLIFTGMEVQRIRWNPANEDEIACCFLNRNEIYLYNLQKFPSKPDLVLKTANRPSSGYTDLVFAPSESPLSAPSLDGASKKRTKVRAGSIVAGDIDGGLRAWDLRFPTKPLWAVSTGTHAVTALVLSRDQSMLLCSTEGGIVMTYDVKKLVVPAFGSKPVPQRKSLIRLADAISSHLSPGAEVALRRSMQESSTALAITSIVLMPASATQVVLQLRNQWLVVLDTSTSAVLKLHTPFKEALPAIRTIGQPLPATVLHSAGNEHDLQHRVAASRQRHSWLHQHRCSVGSIFHGEMICTGLADENALSVVDLNRLDFLRPKNINNGFVGGDNINSPLPVPRKQTAERLSRFCIDVPERVTAVAVHPTQHWILCGGADLQIRILGVSGNEGTHDTSAPVVVAESSEESVSSD